MSFSSSFASGERSVIGLKEDPSLGGLLAFTSDMMFLTFHTSRILREDKLRFINAVRKVIARCFSKVVEY